MKGSTFPTRQNCPQWRESPATGWTSWDHPLGRPRSLRQWVGPRTGRGGERCHPARAGPGCRQRFQRSSERAGGHSSPVWAEGGCETQLSSLPSIIELAQTWSKVGPSSSSVGVSDSEGDVRICGLAGNGNCMASYGGSLSWIGWAQKIELASSSESPASGRVPGPPAWRLSLSTVRASAAWPKAKSWM